MKLIVNPHKIQISEKETVNEKEINITKCEFEFADEITNNFVKEAYFTLGNDTYKKVIVNNECSIPQEVLIKEGTIELGVVAYLVESGEEITRYNPTPVYFKTDLGSLKEAENSEEPTPSEMEQYEQALQDGLADLDYALTDLQDKVDSGYFKGDKGDKGDTGEQGIQGERGLQGEQGIQGEKGEKGDKGDKGDTGSNGLDGAIQYTAGDNITIENNVISAVGGDLTNYYTKSETNALIVNKMPIYSMILDTTINNSGKTNFNSTDASSLATIFTDAIEKQYEVFNILLTFSTSNSKQQILLMSSLNRNNSSILTKPSEYVFVYFQNSSGYVAYPSDSEQISVVCGWLSIYDIVWSGDVCSSLGAQISTTPNNIPTSTGLSNNYLSKTNTRTYAPTANYHPATKKYVDDKLTSYSGYDSSKTQVLKNVSGTLTWVDE